MLKPNSLASRLLLLISLWLSVSLIVTGLFLSLRFKQNAEENFQSLLLAHTYNLMGEIELSLEGKLIGSPDLGDPRFLQPISGWYWTVSAADNPTAPLLHSRSITGENLSVRTVKELPFDNQFRRSYRFSESEGMDVQRLEAQLYLGDSETLYQVMVAGNRRGIDIAIETFNRELVMFFIAFGLGTLAAIFLVIRVGLRPLGTATEALVDIRMGRKDSLAQEVPHEIKPLTQEINALIVANRAVTERARTQVGNLAHALKTPLAVILNEARSSQRPNTNLIEDQANTMRGQIQTYLDRARIAAQTNTLTVRTEVTPEVDQIVRVMRKLAPEKSITVNPIDGSLVFKGEKQDLQEILGNLLENAVRFANSSIEISCGHGTKEGESLLFIAVDDDGPGLNDDQKQHALKRGERLDETAPGSGLGLSIVRDIATEYGGKFFLEDSQLSGLRAVVFLPRSAIS